MKVILAHKVTPKLTLLDLVIKLGRSISPFPDISLKVIYTYNKAMDNSVQKNMVYLAWIMRLKQCNCFFETPCTSKILR